MTQYERDFAEKHHYLVKDFLRRKRLSPDDYYDVVIFRYLRTVQLYCNESRLRKWSFKTVANSAMEWAMKTHWKRYYNAPRPLSLNVAYTFTGRLPLTECIASEEMDVCEQVTDTLSAEELLNSLPKFHAKVLSLKADGHSCSEISAMTNAPTRQINHTLVELRDIVSLGNLDRIRDRSTCTLIHNS